MYAEHVLLYGLVLLLLDLIQNPYHGIVVMLVTECLLHVHQQVLHGDILAFIQCAGPFTGVPTETGKNVRAHACLIILLEEGIHIEPQECVRHLCPWIGRLKDWHIQSRRHQQLLLLTPSTAPAFTPVACSLTHSGVPIRVRCPSIRGGRRQASSAHHCALGFRWSSTWLHSPWTGGKPASAVPSTALALPACWGALPTSCTKESDSPAFTTGILWTGFSAQLLSLRQSEAATAHCYAFIRGKWLMVKWAKCKIYSEKASSMWV